MNTFILPTDLSVDLAPTLSFAIRIAGPLDARIQLLILSPAPSDETFIVKDQDERQMLARNAGVELVTRVKKNLEGNVPIEILVREGDPAEIILAQAENGNATLIIFQRGGVNNIDEFNFTTTVSDIVLQKAPCPVLVMPPPGEKPFTLQRITYATDYTSADLQALKTLVMLAAPFNAEISILHVATGETPMEEDVETLSAFAETMAIKIGFDSFSTELLSADEVESRLLTYLHDGKTDLLALATAHRNFFTRLLEPSLTADVSRVSTVPIMGFHLREKKPIKIFS